MNCELLISYLMDKCFGDPAWLPHPVVYFGKWIAWGEKHLNHGTPGARWLKGAAFSTISILAVLWGSLILLAWLRNIVFHISDFALHLDTPVSIFLIFFCLAGTTLIREVRMVFEATERSLNDGRKQVARIVGRNTEELSRDEIHAAALETLAENLSDGVVAPLFWYALLGVPGMLAYKMVNTLDSMIGYHTERYIDFGCWAAKVDDTANYIPARLTALLMLLVSIIIPSPIKGGASTIKKRLAFTLRYAKEHASPNSGWPEAALASILNCRFGGPHYYFGEYFPKPYIGTNQRSFAMEDMHIATRINLYVEIVCIAIICLI